MESATTEGIGEKVREDAELGNREEVHGCT